MGEGVELRALIPADLPEIMEIEMGAFSTPWRRATFEGLLQRDDTDMIGALREGALVGYAVCWTIADQAELGNVAVARTERGRGTGRVLVREALERVRRRGARECFLEVRESNRVAQSLYLQMGFEFVGRRRRYYTAPTEDAFVMRAQLG